MKPNLKIGTSPKLSKHKYSNSSIPTQPSTTKTKAPSLIFKSSTSLNSPTAKLLKSPSRPFPLSPNQSSRLKVPKFETIEDIAKWSSMSLPVNPAKVLKEFSQHLTADEQNEISSYHEIFYIGVGTNKSTFGSHNFGYDDSEGDYLITIGDHLLYRYEILAVLGGGSFGKVVKVRDHKSKLELAVKIIKNKPKFFDQAKEEIEVLKYLQSESRQNRIITLEEFFVFRCHACLIFELLDLNLYQCIKLNNYTGFNLQSVKTWAQQILSALSFLDSAKVIHCDLKPENILFKTSDHKEVVVIDLGSATFNDRKIYNYIQSRYYRAPEVVLGLEYSSAIDIWSFGCILVELLNGYPLFVAENEVELIQCMMELLGPPPARLVNKAAHKNLFFDIDGKPKVIPNSKGKKRNPGSRRLRDVIRGADLNLIALLKACLEWDQLQRITAVEALNHPWFTGRQEPIIKHVKSQSTFSATRHLSLSKPKRK